MLEFEVELEVEEVLRFEFVVRCGFEELVFRKEFELVLEFAGEKWISSAQARRPITAAAVKPAARL